LLELRGMSMTDFAALTGISRQAWYIAFSRKELTIGQLRMCCKALNVPADALISVPEDSLDDYDQEWMNAAMGEPK
jgi:transcriptional regulator with XRE-family HTH domain